MTSRLDPIDHPRRLRALQEALRERVDQGGPGVFMFTDPVSIRWCTGFAGSSGWLVVTTDQAVFGTDGRYLDRCEAEFRSAGLTDLVDLLGSSSRAQMDAAMVGVCSGRGPVGAAGAQISHQRWAQLTEQIPLVDVADPVGMLRRSKDAEEIQRIELAAAIADQALADTLGMIELSHLPTEVEFRTEIEYRMRRLGADGPSYDTIVACGPEHAARPHHEASPRRMEVGETLIVDVGALVDGYHSDMTRSFLLGEPSAEQHRLYGLVAEVQAAGLAVLGPGVPAGEVDAACRARVAEAGLSDWYLHSTGHGVGLEIHENPFHAPGVHAELVVGDVVTVEPGLYRAGFGGLRIEDLLLITEDGYRVLTHSPKDFPCLPSPPTT